MHMAMCRSEQLGRLQSMARKLRQDDGTFSPRWWPTTSVLWPGGDNASTVLKTIPSCYQCLVLLWHCQPILIGWQNNNIVIMCTYYLCSVTVPWTKVAGGQYQITLSDGKSSEDKKLWLTRRLCRAWLLSGNHCLTLTWRHIPLMLSARTFTAKLLKCNKTHDTFTADSNTSFVFLVLTFDTRVVTVSVKTHNNGAERIKPKYNNLNEWLI